MELATVDLYMQLKLGLSDPSQFPPWCIVSFREKLTIFSPSPSASKAEIPYPVRKEVKIPNIAKTDSV